MRVETRGEDEWVAAARPATHVLHADDDRELRLVLAVPAEEGLAHLVRG